MADSILGMFNFGFTPSIMMWEAGSSETTPDDSDGMDGLDPIGDDDLSGIVDTSITGTSTSSFMFFKFDGVPSEGHTSQSIITKFPMSNGFVVSDHMIKQNRILKLHVIAANMQNSILWSAANAVTDGVLADAMPIIGLIGSAGDLLSSAFTTDDRVASTFKLLNNLMAKGTRVHISTILGPYINCVITGIEVVQDKDTSAILSGEIILEELQVVGEDSTTSNIRSYMQTDTDYSRFMKVGTSIGMTVLEGM